MKKLLTSSLAITTMASAPAFADFTINIDDEHKISFGGYFKVDVKNVNGDIAYRDFWIGNNVAKQDTNETRLNVKESRFNIKYANSQVKAVVEWDLYDDQQPNGTTETVTGGHSLRLRHAYIDYGKWRIGQSWSTFVPLVSIADSLNLGGALVGQAFVRQTQVRYTHNGLELALENPSTQSGESQSIPDVIARYTIKQDWGQIAVAGLVRHLDKAENSLAAEGSQFAYNLHGRIKTFGRDDFRFSYENGRSGRYVSPGANINDFANSNGDIHKTQAYNVAYRHFWSDRWRSSLFYGASEIDAIKVDRSHWGFNLIKNITQTLSLGGEVGNYKTESGNSDYFQVSAKYVL